MFNREKRKALSELVGEDIANQLISTLQGREKSAQASGVAYKALEPSPDTVVDDFSQALANAFKDFFDTTPDTAPDTATTEKCTPGTKDGKYMGRSGKAEEDMMSEDESEGDEEDASVEDVVESLLTEEEIGLLADAVAKRLMSSMDEMKAKMESLDQEMKTRGYGRMKSTDDTVLSTLKEYTDSQSDFSEALVSVLEELNARLKSIEEFQQKDGHIASQSFANVIKSATNQAMLGMTAQESAAYDMWFRNQQ